MLRDRIKEITKKLYECAFEDSVKSPYMIKGSGYGTDQATASILQAFREVVPKPERLINSAYGFNLCRSAILKIINAEIDKGGKNV